MMRRRLRSGLDLLLDLAAKYEAPLALAVIPDGLDASLAARIDGAVSVLQHGFSHTNYAPPPAKKMELGGHRAAGEIRRELTDGFAVLRDAFGARFLPVLVPPWNRIADSTLADLSPIGFAGLSTFGARTSFETANLRVVNTHVDIINWKRGRAFVGESQAAAAIVAHLRGKRLGEFDGGEATGLMTHHLVHDRQCTAFLARLLAALDEHPAAKWLSAEVVFGVGGVI